MKKAGNWLVVAIRPSLLFFGSYAFIVFLLWFLLGTLVPGFSDSELAARGTATTARAIADNPLGLPHKILQFIPQHFNYYDPLALRSASAFLGLFVVGCFYFVLSNWYSRRVAVLGTLLFVTSSWFLHGARLGTDVIMYALLFGAIACVLWLQRSRASIFAIFASVVLVVMLLYIPGMIWFVVPAVIWQSQRIVRFLSQQSPVLLSLIAFTAAVALVPLVWALYREPTLVRTFFGLPQDFPAPLQVVKNIARVPLHIFVRSPGDPVVGLARLPLLDWFAATMFVIGLYAYFFKRRLDRTWLVAYVGGMGMVLIGLAGPVNISLLLPFVYLVIAGGLALMLQQWFTVFPFNPVARTLGAILMTLAVLMSSYYNFSQYFIAWPNAPETKQVFQKK